MISTRFFHNWTSADLESLGDLTVAELEARSFDGIVIDCPGCRCYAGLGFRGLFKRGHIRPTTSIQDLLGRLRCTRCGRRPGPGDSAPWRVADEQRMRS